MVETASLAWGPSADSADSDVFRNAFDVILAADVLYDPGSHEDFAATLERITAPGGQVFIALQSRGMSGESFFSNLLPPLSWGARRLDIGDIFADLDSTAQFRE